MKIMLTKKRALTLVILLSVLLNLQIFLFAYPQTFGPLAPDLARDFSAYYIASWRLFHNPTAIYYEGVQPGDYQFVGQPQTFRYPPSLLILFVPFIALDYQNALNTFNIIQFLSILAAAFFIYRLIENKPLILACVVAEIVLVNPLLFPLIFSPSGGHGLADFLHFRIYSLHVQTISPLYYSGYLTANAHILQNTLLIGALYFGFTKKPWLSALLFTFGSIDPRASLPSFLLLVWYNRQAIRKFIAGSAAFLAAANLPFFFYYGIGFAFLREELRARVVFDFTLYDWIPLYSIIALILLEVLTAIYRREIHFRRPKIYKLRQWQDIKKSLTRKLGKQRLHFYIKQAI